MRTIERNQGQVLKYSREIYLYSHIFPFTVRICAHLEKLLNVSRSDSADNIYSKMGRWPHTPFREKKNMSNRGVLNFVHQHPQIWIAEKLCKEA